MTSRAAAARVTRIVKVVVGFTLLALGVLMLVLPGPGWLAIAVGLAMLAGEFIWAKRLLDRVKAGAGRVRQTMRKKKGDR
jgi:uncharacterized protein (TIGR02611 family)